MKADMGRVRRESQRREEKRREAKRREEKSREEKRREEKSREEQNREEKRREERVYVIRYTSCVTCVGANHGGQKCVAAPQSKINSSAVLVV